MLSVPRLSALVGALVITALAPATAGAQTAPVVPPIVTHSGTAPTGYEVTFRYYSPTATAVSIKGGWSFSNPSKAADDPQNLNPIAPADWKPGDFQLQSPNQPSENWPVARMSKDDATGIWSYTVPLPSGWTEYQFYPNCAATPPSTTGCTAVTDPANAPITGCATAGCTTSTYPLSSVYVPSDSKFGTDDLSWQTDAPEGQRGKIENINYLDPLATSGRKNMVVYTPPGYNPNRAEPYPVYVLTHGGGENELAWINRGRAAQILDQEINSGRIQPVVVTMPSTGGLAAAPAGAITAYANDVAKTILPYMEANYNVAKAAAGRAFSGTSANGSSANNFMFGSIANGFTVNDAGRFGYYSPMSPAAQAPPITVSGQGAAPTAAAYQKPEIKGILGIDVAIGSYDLGGNAPMLTAITERQGLQNAGVPFRWYSVPGGHTWTFWRLALRDFLEHTAFRATSTSITAGAGTLTATVSPASPQPAKPSGTVQFIAGGKLLGAPVPLVNGVATLAAPDTAGGTTVSAVYAGDSLYNVSTSPIVSYAATSALGAVAASVPATLSISLGAPASFGSFTAGQSKTYEAATTANVISTAGDAALSVADPSATANGHLVNGTFSLAQPLQARARNATNTTTSYGNVGSSTSPLNLVNYSGPTSNDSLALQFSQQVNANDPLRTGSYAKSLTFTLSTTTP
jgi:enterochelin esterase-like enzyme